MAIQKPDIYLSTNDKKLLQYVSQLILENDKQAACQANNFANAPENYVVLSDQQAEELLSLLEKLLEHKEFKKASSFLEGIVTLNSTNEKHVRSLYTSARSEKGRSSGITHHHWYGLKSRLGIKGASYMGKKITPMSVTYFLQMEEKLFENVGINPRVIRLLMALANTRRDVLIDFQKEHAFPEGVPLIKSIYNIQQRVKEEHMLSKLNLGAIAFVVSNSSVLFTTRDWSAAGVFSCMIGQTFSFVKHK